MNRESGHADKSSDSLNAEQSAAVDFGQNDRLVDWLALGYSNERAATEVGVSAKTVYRRLQDKDFRTRVSARTREIRSESMASVRGLREKAIERLGELLDSDNERVALAAIRTVLDTSSRFHVEQAYEEIKEQLAALNSELEASANGIDSKSQELDDRDSELMKREVEAAKLEERLVKRAAFIAQTEEGES